MIHNNNNNNNNQGVFLELLVAAKKKPQLFTHFLTSLSAALRFSSFSSFLAASSSTLRLASSSALFLLFSSSSLCFLISSSLRFLSASICSWILRKRACSSAFFWAWTFFLRPSMVASAAATRVVYSFSRATRLIFWPLIFAMDESMACCTFLTSAMLASFSLVSSWVMDIICSS